MTQEKTGKKRNIWKWLFLILLAGNLAFFGTIAYRLLDGGRPSTQSTAATRQSDVQIGTITTTRTELNNAISAYLSDYVKDGQYQFYATQEQMVFEGSYTLLGYAIPLTCYFTPQKTSDGNITLKMTSFHAGSLSLPSREILRYLKSSVTLPDFVVVDVANESISLNLVDMASQATANTYLKVNQLNLASDDISFTIFKKMR